MNRIIIIPPDAAEDLIKFISLDEKALSFFADILSKDYSVSLIDLLKTIPNGMLKNTEELYDYFYLLEFLKSQKEDRGLTAEELIENIKLYFKENNSELQERLEKAEVKAPLLKIFEKTNEQLLSEKINEVSKGFFYNCFDFKSFCEIRPFFNIERTKIIKNIPVITMNIEVLRNEGETKNYIFQITEEKLNNFKEFLELTSKKLEILKVAIKKLENTDVSEAL